MAIRLFRAPREQETEHGRANGRKRENTKAHVGLPLKFAGLPSNIVVGLGVALIRADSLHCQGWHTCEEHHEGGRVPRKKKGHCAQHRPRQQRCACRHQLETCLGSLRDLSRKLGMLCVVFICPRIRGAGGGTRPLSSLPGVGIATDICHSDIQMHFTT